MKLWSLIFLFVSWFSHWTVAHSHVSYHLSSGVLSNVSAFNTSLVDLSNRHIKYIIQKSLDNLTNIDELDLSNNELESLPLMIFARLVDLKILSLANNNLSTFAHVFLGLISLEILDLSGNSIKALKTGALFGLTDFVEVNVMGNRITQLSNRMLRRLPVTVETKRKGEEYGKDTMHQVIDCDFGKSAGGIVEFVRNCKFTKSGPRIPGLVEAIVEGPDGRPSKLSITIPGINGFKPHWYDQTDFNFSVISFTGNSIKKLTTELINYLPPNVKTIQITLNRIRKIENNGFDNENLRSMNLSHNFIEYIEDGAFENLNLNILKISYNFLRNMNFVRTLPASITELNLDYNIIGEVPENSLHHLKNLEVLSMKFNQLVNIEGVFNELENLSHLDLRGNRIHYVASGHFRGMNKLNYVALSGNRIRIIPSDFLSYWNYSGRPDILLGENCIHTIGKGVFFNHSLGHVGLSLTNLESPPYTHGSHGILMNIFNNSDISRMTLLMTGIQPHGHWFEGISGLQEVNLRVSRVKHLDKCFYGPITKYMRNITKLSLIMPDLESIDAGALHFWPKNKEVMVSLQTPKLRIIRAGIFEDHQTCLYRSSEFME